MKRFFQGLGVGILGTTLIFSIAYYTIGNKKMTDAQIINEAGKLGMVKATEAPLFTDNQGEQTPDDTQQQAQPGNGDANSLMAVIIQSRVMQPVQTARTIMKVQMDRMMPQIQTIRAIMEIRMDRMILQIQNRHSPTKIIIQSTQQLIVHSRVLMDRTNRQEM